MQLLDRNVNSECVTARDILLEEVGSECDICHAIFDDESEVCDLCRKSCHSSCMVKMLNGDKVLNCVACAGLEQQRLDSEKPNATPLDMY